MSEAIDILARINRDGRSHQRAVASPASAIDEAARTAELAFATEEPRERWWGLETLEVSKKAMRTARLKSGINLLCDHDTRDVVGVVESFRIDSDNVARATVRFGKSARADEVFRDVVDGIRRNVSVGYIIHEAKTVAVKDGVETVRISDWEPIEVSLVSVPADPDCGVGRSTDRLPARHETPSERTIAMSESTAPVAAVESAPVKPAAAAAPTSSARDHAAEITRIASALPGGAELAMRSIQAGHTVEQFQAEALRHLASKPVPTADIGMTPKEVKRYSVMRAINALANPQDRRAVEAAAFERECSDAVAQRMGKAPGGLFVPHEVQKRDLTVGTASAGGNTVSTDLLSGDFIELLRNAMALSQMGVRVLPGLVGNIAIPKQTGSATAYWVAESGAPTESQQAFGQVTMTPKTVGAYTDISRKLMLQSSIDIEAFVQRDLAIVLGLAIEQAAISGSGSGGQPTGIITAVTAATVGGTNGAAPTWDHIVSLETNIAVANAAVGNLGYLTNAKVRGKLKRTFIDGPGTGERVWQSGDMPLNGYKAGVTNAVPSNLDKGASTGVCSAIIFGNWADLVIGMWGALDLQVDPYTQGTSGTVRVRVLQDVDVAIRHVESFDTMEDATTT